MTRDAANLGSRNSGLGSDVLAIAASNGTVVANYAPPFDWSPAAVAVDASFLYVVLSTISGTVTTTVLRFDLATGAIVGTYRGTSTSGEASSIAIDLSNSQLYVGIPPPGGPQNPFSPPFVQQVDCATMTFVRNFSQSLPYPLAMAVWNSTVYFTSASRQGYVPVYSNLLVSFPTHPSLCPFPSLSSPFLYTNVSADVTSPLANFDTGGLAIDSSGRRYIVIVGDDTTGGRVVVVGVDGTELLVINGSTYFGVQNVAVDQNGRFMYRPLRTTA